MIEITHDVEKPNGVAFAPDENTLYVGDHNNGTDKIDPTAPPPKPGAMKVYAFPLDSDGLVNGPKRTIVDFGAENGCDGMCVDIKGNLYLACRSLKRPGIMVSTPPARNRIHPDRPAESETRRRAGRAAEQLRVRHRRRRHDALPDDRQEPVSHSAESCRLSRAVQAVFTRFNKREEWR